MMGAKVHQNLRHRYPRNQSRVQLTKRLQDSSWSGCHIESMHLEDTTKFRAQPSKPQAIQAQHAKPGSYKIESGNKTRTHWPEIRRIPSWRPRKGLGSCEFQETHQTEQPPTKPARTPTKQEDPRTVHGRRGKSAQGVKISSSSFFTLICGWCHGLAVT
jgi:hypothetical protein